MCAMQRVLHRTAICGERVRSRRLNRKLTQEDLADTCNHLPPEGEGPSKSTIQKIEQGVLNSASDRLVWRLARALQTTVEYLAVDASEDGDTKEGAGALGNALRSIREAHDAQTSKKARLLLRTALGQLQPEGAANDVLYKQRIVRSRILAALAIEEDHPAERSARWRDCFAELSRAWTHCQGVEIALLYGGTAVDCAQDPFADLAPSFRRKTLKRARDILDKCLDQLVDARTDEPTDSARPAIFRAGAGVDQDGAAHHPRRVTPVTPDNEYVLEDISLLLARKASVMRHQAMFAHPEGAKKTRESALRCARRANDPARRNDSSRLPAVCLEVALCEWACAYDQPTRESYAESLGRVNAILTDSVLGRFEAALLTLARFYRLTDRFLDACRTYDRLLELPLSSRRTLWNAFIYGEAAVRLAYQHDRESHERLESARRVLHRALAAGYRHARLIAALTHVTAALHGRVEADALLDLLGDPERSIDWQKALNLVATADAKQLLPYAFSLGLNDAGVWNALGTVFKDLGDHENAEKMYRGAKQLNEHYVFALKNLAELLRCKHDPDSHREAHALEQRASAIADARGRELLGRKWAGVQFPTSPE